MGIEIFKKHIRENRAIKVCASTYNENELNSILNASKKALVSAIEIECEKNLYDIARKSTKLPIFTSSIHPFEILKAVQWGIDAVQIGNFKKTFKEKTIYSFEEYSNIILETLSLINSYDIYTIVSIPTTYLLSDITRLVKKLELFGVDLIQIEGFRQEDLNLNTIYVEDLEFAIQDMVELQKITSIPIMISGGIERKTSRVAFVSGASAVSISTSLENCISEVELMSEISGVVASIQNRNSINKEIPRSYMKW